LSCVFFWHDDMSLVHQMELTGICERGNSGWDMLAIGGGRKIINVPWIMDNG
jgi:hypothetical protein